MPDEKVVAHAWPLPEGLETATVWAGVVGELTGYGASRRSAVRDVVYPHLVTRGRGIFTSRSGSFEVGPGDMFCIWPGIAHEFHEHPHEPWHFYWMRLQGGGAEAFGHSLGFSSTCPTCRPAEPARAIRCWQQMFELYSRHERGDPYRALSLLFELVSACRHVGESCEDGDRQRRLVQEARALLESLLDTGINVAALADRLHVSRQRLLRAFREELDVTPVDCIQQMRLQRAKRLLAKTGLKVSAVARACGYGNEKYFYRRFRELTGQTPAKWRSSPGR